MSSSALFGANPDHQSPELSEEQSVIVQLKYLGNILSEAIFIYTQPDYILVPLGEIVTALEFPIQVDVDRQMASGWFFSEDQTFNADFQKGEVYIKGTKTDLPQPLLVISDGFDLYVSIDYLVSWFGIKANFLHSQLILDIKTEKPLPLLARLEREKKRTLLSMNKSQQKSLPIVENTYQSFVAPGLDVQYSLLSNAGALTNQFNLQGSGDFLYHESRYLLTTNDQTGIDSARLSFSRNAKTSDDHLMFGSNYYEFGDILSFSDPLINLSSSGVGAKIIRGSSVQAESYGRHVLEGDGQVGWEVELYRNGLLIDFQLIPNSGRYVFDNVELLYGENIFDLILYGPQGQKRSRRETIRVGDQMISPGEYTYTVSHLRKNDSIFGYGDITSTSDPSAGVSQIQTHFGFSEKHTVGLGLFRQLAQTRNPYSTLYQRASLNSAWSWLTTSVSYANQKDAGDAQHFIGIGRFLDFNWSVEHRAFDDFHTTQSEQGSLDHETSMSLDSSFSQKLGRQWRYKIDLTKRSLLDVTQYQLDSRLATRFGSMRWINETSVNYNSMASVQNAQGRLNFNRTMGSKRYRGALNYTLAPKLELNALNLIYDFVHSNKLRYQWHSNLGLNKGASQSMGFSASKRFEKLIVSANADYDTHLGLSLLLKFELGLKLHNNWPYAHLIAPGLSDSGTVLARVFLDQDMNHTWSEGDEPLPGISFLGRTQWETHKTDENGQVRLGQFGSQGATRLRLNELSLEDPYLHCENQELLVYSHAGSLQQVEFPIVMTTEIEGSIFFRKGGKTKPGSGIALILRTESGEVVSHTRSEFDGFYFFTAIPPGQYFVDLDPELINKEEYTFTAVAVKASLEQGVSYVEDILVQAKEDH